ncbi:hypothetical protein [Paracoccus aminovorans]|uniref:hypothetical protein n=1 Tax=Paracoccus aminovorans TaxID=34004 RepID=UPI000781BC0A|nr:hypothetical protein [Paracoccus aminovorans]
MLPNRREIDPLDQFLARLIRGKSTYPGCSDFRSHLCATPLCRQNLEAFDGFLASSAPAWSYLFRPALNRELPQTVARERADAAAEIAAQLGLPPDALD